MTIMMTNPTIARAVNENGLGEGEGDEVVELVGEVVFGGVGERAGDEVDVELCAIMNASAGDQSVVRVPFSEFTCQ